ncbi:hypothetical protein R69658_06847 [Paraburkholderia aspalathi]|uniref:Phasin protein n=1 Tax=Paraburkholderia aspalathi TaxID=1324617 RepID=A0ABM8SZ70_9BURK|nr:hypothetical protein [Paraburkholderia aspalathi]MBK3823214.1 hypothetical protein [Paraburkholderia aspalathi]MBK3835045.1 hypothetical protein [Paraburkholderia aspalathi]MBK3864783.1 hypothetical protein [Paraburkholderia aspalathi]CAE6843836.1 hypothetical protein R69658_06847 [Paraburkholderia aspalathi]
MADEKLNVEFDPGFMRVSMDMWRSATDMTIPVLDTFKFHFMEQRQSLLMGFVKTGKAWLMVLATMTSTAQGSELDTLRAEVKVFAEWAERGLAELAARRD